MGSCLSKKTILSSSSKQEITKSNTPLVEKKKLVEGQIVRKEIFVIKHRISHEGGGSKDEKSHFKNSNDVAKNATFSGDLAKNANFSGKSAPMRTTSSCSKEEIDAMLIQCGRISRSSSTSRSRKCSSSKKSFDFDYENTSDGGKENDADDEDDAVAANRVHRHRQREHHSSQGRRRTLSREIEQSQQQQQQRSGSRERCSSEGGRRVSRSPGRRSESPRTISNTNANGMIVKMVSVPATVSSVMIDKRNDAGNAELISTAAIQRIQVTRNVGAASPRARSPARLSAKVSNENRPLSRSNSRRKEGSPFRRNPLNEIEPMPFYPQKLKEQQQLEDGAKALRTVTGNAAVDEFASGLDSYVPPRMRSRRSSRLSQDLDINLEITGNAAVEVVDSGLNSPVPQETRSNRSLRLSRDLDVDLGVVSTPTQSYTDLLLQDIQNFHQKSNNTAVALPPCVTKARSIVEAVDDLNASTSSSLSSAISEDRKRIPTVEQISNTYTSSGANTFRRGSDGGGMEELESAGSNSSVCGQQRSFSLNSGEPNSADSTDSWAASKSYSRLHFNPLAFQKHTIYESALNMDEGKRRATANMIDSDNQQRGIGRYSVVPRGLHTSMAPTAASAT